MKRNTYFAVSAGVLMLAVSSPLLGQDSLATMRGTVVDQMSGAPLASVSVYLSGTETSYVTGADGWFELRDLPAGPQTLIFRRIGFMPRGFRFILSENHMGVIEMGQIAVERQITELEDIVVEEVAGGGRLQGFFQRRDRGFGDFVTREDVERLNPRESTDLLRSIPGLDIKCRGSDCQVGLARQTRPLGQTIIGASQDVDELGGGIALIGRNQENITSDSRDVVGGIVGRTAFFCPVRYFVDGVPYDAAGGINDISPESIEGIEVYKGPAHVPAQYASQGGSCGVILIWTRKPQV